MADDFRTTEVGERYAQALFDLALETGRLDAVRADVLSLKAAWTESADLRRLATSPVIAADDQAKGLVAIAAKAKFEKNTANFLGLLAQNGRARDLPAVIAGYALVYGITKNAIDSGLVLNLLGGMGGLVIGISAIVNLNALGESVFSR